MSDKTETAQPPVEPIRQYFNNDILKAMSAMSDKEMLAILKELPESQFWIAILKYNQARLGMSQSMLFSTDPVREPTAIARNQGILLGLSDLQNAVISLNAPQQNTEEE